MVSTESEAAMEAARNAVREFMIKNGHHDTTIHEKVAPAVYHETVARSEHEEVVTAIDREVHISHYHTSVQPVTDTETLDPTHHHNLLPLDSRTFEHDDREEVQRRLEAEQAKFRHEVQHVDGERTRDVVPVMAGEHVHHHVFEVIQPVVNKHVVEPHIIHTTVKIHEVHHNAATHHSTSSLPTVTMAEFVRQGGILVGREERYDFFEGEPRNVGGSVDGRAHNANNAAGSNATTSGAESVARRGSSAAPADVARRGSSAGQAQAPQQVSAEVARRGSSAAPSQAPQQAPADISRRGSSTPAPTQAPATQQAPAQQQAQPAGPTPSTTAVHNAGLSPQTTDIHPSTTPHPAGRWSLMPIPPRGQHAGAVMQSAGQAQRQGSAADQQARQGSNAGQGGEQSRG